MRLYTGGYMRGWRQVRRSIIRPQKSKTTVGIPPPSVYAVHPSIQFTPLYRRHRPIATRIGKKADAHPQALLEILRLCLKNGRITGSGRFFASQSGLTQPHFVYGWENQRRAAEKDLPFRRFQNFQTRSGSIEVKDGNFPQGLRRVPGRFQKARPPAQEPKGA